MSLDTSAAPAGVATIARRIAALAEEKRICEQIQLQAFQDVPYIPLGAFFFAGAYRSNLTGIIKGGIPMFYNVKKG